MNLASLVTNESSLTPDDPCIGRVCDERLPLEGAAVSSAVGVSVLDVGDVPLDLVHGGHLPHLDAARPLPVPQLRVHHLHDDEFKIFLLIRSNTCSLHLHLHHLSISFPEFMDY